MGVGARTRVAIPYKTKVPWGFWGETAILGNALTPEWGALPSGKAFISSVAPSRRNLKSPRLLMKPKINCRNLLLKTAAFAAAAAMPLGRFFFMVAIAAQTFSPEAKALDRHWVNTFSNDWSTKVVRNQALPLALPVNLGVAGPGNFTVLQIGNGNISGSAGGGQGGIFGNVGIWGTGNVGVSAGNFPIAGNLYLGTSASANAATIAAVTGMVFQDAATQAFLNQARADAIGASMAASALATSGGGVGITIINSTMVLSPGVYNISSLNLGNNEVLTLTPGGSYVFNIAGNMTLNSGRILTSAGLSETEVLFNVGGDLSTSGGLNNESEIHGIVLAVNGSASLSPGLVIGEIIAGQNINISSGAEVYQIPEGSTLSLLFLGLIVFAGLARRLRSQAAVHCR